jgi:DNA invertase Pin-like site-specific DNA recombinase
MDRCWGYARVSTDEQFNSRLSIEEQRRKIREFCQANRLDLGPHDERLGEESASAYHLSFLERPLGKVLDGQMQAGDHICIAKLDRAFRDMTNAFNTVQAWQDRGIVVHILDIPFCGNPIFDRLILAVLAWCAEFESHRKSERMVDAYRSARRRGRPISQCAPLGFRWIGHRATGTHKLVYFPEEREHMRLCYDLAMTDRFSLWEIASRLMCRKLKPFDKRAPDARAGSKLKVSQEYHPRKIRDIVRTEAEFRFYEAQGLEPEEAAAEWLLNWGEGTLPTQEELQEWVDASYEAEIQTQKKGGTTCESQITN